MTNSCDLAGKQSGSGSDPATRVWKYDTCKKDIDNEQTRQANVAVLGLLWIVCWRLVRDNERRRLGLPLDCLLGMNGFRGTCTSQVVERKNHQTNKRIQSGMQDR